MSESDSFLDEVSEEVRRDRLLKFIKKNAVFVIGGLALVLGGTAYNEYSKSQARAMAQARGDAMVNALEMEDSGDRVAALEELLGTAGASAPLVKYQLAAAHALNEDRKSSLEVLSELATDPDLSAAYKDTARLKIAMLGGDLVDAQERATILEQLSAPGHPLRSLAMEQSALVLLKDGDADGAIEIFRELAGDPDTLPGVKERATQMLLVLGAEPILAETANG